MRTLTLTLTAFLILCSCAGQVERPTSGTLGDTDALQNTGNTIASRFNPPVGFNRNDATEGSFGHYLRNLPLKPAGAPVHLYNGELKHTQSVHAGVVDLSVGQEDLQQCADAVMRLRAEHLYASGKQDAIAFNFTSGFLAEWKRWRSGERIRVAANRCTWVSGDAPDSSRVSFLAYLKQVFTYAGTMSLARELNDASALPLAIGDVFIHGGSPGHAVTVVDVAHNAEGQEIFMLAQSYMPAQDIHMLRDLENESISPWFELNRGDKLYTPEWTFEWADRKRWP